MDINKGVSLVRFTSTDHLLLAGCFFSEGHKKAVIHVHGLAGNFYASSYHFSLAQKYARLGFDYFTFNNRGAEYVKKLKNVRTGKKSYYGFSFECFEEADRDILGAVNFLKEKGYREVVLQGHSSGAQKLFILFATVLSPCP